MRPAQGTMNKMPGMWQRTRPLAAIPLTSGHVRSARELVQAVQGRKRLLDLATGVDASAEVWGKRRPF